MSTCERGKNYMVACKYMIKQLHALNPFGRIENKKIAECDKTFETNFYMEKHVMTHGGEEIT